MLWEDLINSYWRDWRTGDRSKDRDMLEDSEWVSAWLQQHRLETDALPDQAETEQLKQLRSHLWAAVQSIVQEQPRDPALLEQLNHYMAPGPVTRKVTWNAEHQRYEMNLLPRYNHWDQVMAEIAASFATALFEKETSRFRICENGDCLWVYYDDTRNRSKRYCDDKACGNLMKVRRFRARRKAEMEGGETLDR
ncbi:CGNR zinc finger domain-containing protein [Paenibacillus sp. NPDC058177]|uniref:CGNR zinc finger domain-containing protein n=1 Tax=Paenibacillus sp. NPDC058177 TaxID=3346369 RepID=UPI0036DA4903